MPRSASAAGRRGEPGLLLPARGRRRSRKLSPGSARPFGISQRGERVAWPSNSRAPSVTSTPQLGRNFVLPGAALIRPAINHPDRHASSREDTAHGSKIIPVAVFDCVVFGATGDLTLRKLLPALYYRFRDGQMPADSPRIIGAARSDLTDESYRERAAEALQRHVAAADLERGGWPAGSARSCTTSASTRTDGSRLGPLGGRAGARCRSACGSSTSPPRPTCTARSAAISARTAWSRRNSRVVLEKPIGHDLRLRARHQRPGRRGVHRGADLPHRPLSRQGDGAEPAGAALRQLDLRAAVERRRDRPRADHGGRDGRRGRAAAATTTTPARCATWCRTTCCSCSACIAMEPPVSLDADAVRDEKLKVLRALRPIAPHEVGTLHGARPVHRRARSTASRCPATRPISAPTSRAAPKPSSR